MCHELCGLSAIDRLQQLWHMQSMHYGPTANIWITRKVIAEIGGFNEALFSRGRLWIPVSGCIPVGRLTPVFAERVAVGHPPRNFLSLLPEKQAFGLWTYGFTQPQKSLESKFSFINSVKRNLDNNPLSVKIPFNVQCLAYFLYGHRLLLKIYYKLFLSVIVRSKKSSSIPARSFRKMTL